MPITINTLPMPPGASCNPQVPSDLFTAAGTGSGTATLKHMRKVKFSLEEAGVPVTMEDYHIYYQHWKDKTKIEHLIWTIVFEGVEKGNGYKLTVENVKDPTDK